MVSPYFFSRERMAESRDCTSSSLPGLKSAFDLYWRMLSAKSSIS